MTMRRTLVLITLFLFAPLSVMAMSHGGGKDLPEADGKALYQYITQTENYQTWPLWPGTTNFYEGTQPHGALLTTYVNEPAMEGLKESPADLPDGAIIVKENYTPDKKLAAVTVMYKKQGYNPEAGDYFWLKYGPDGKIEKEGKAKGCINCHSAAKGNDLLFNNDKK